ncbi:SDR family oxidoreductase [Rhodococcus sp. D2-41]|uniref:SDR family oxidoreductase n=1 Tax=Speluncibacter jeojiensis TaxID=2710754 RepID=A0A9X4LW41_9ACTN|nr:SDR family oxidoreductase [Rhodococcus sp. D2-41]MDG3011847.1 SDR family oxidoreductase [Rhodococcus sp. D2-41]MDG3013299.1 SDR family oxidoreductase [Corynebacteriales bacterium D3-21]
MAKITIIGGHGKVALRLARLLSAVGHEVHSWVRNPDHGADVAAAGGTAVVADLETMSVEQMAELLRGKDAVVWSAGAGGGDPKRTYAVDRDAAIRSMSAAEQAGVRRYVMVSYFYDRPDHGVPEDSSFYPYAEAKAAADGRLQASGLDWTILGPSALRDEPGGSRIETGAGVAKSSVSRDDVAAVAAYVLDHPETAGRVIDFNGGDAPIAEVLG